MKTILLTGLILNLIALTGCVGNKKINSDVIPTLSFNNEEGRVGDSISLSPQNLTAGSVIRLCSISPALPSGLSIDPLTCVIAGTPTVGISETKFTITATNKAASVQASLILRVQHFRGEPVATFGNADGSALFDIRTDTNVSGTWYKDVIRGMTIQPDGKILVTGETSAPVGFPTDGFVARVNTDGSLDTTFAAGGKFFYNTAFNAREYMYDVEVHNNKIYVFGTGRTSGLTNSARATILRLNMNGTLDTTFGTNGEVVFFTAAETSFIFRAKILDDGKMIVQGYNISPARQWFVSKLNADGSFDTTFGTNGTFTLLSATTNISCDLLVDDKGKIFVLVTVGESVDYKTTVFKLTANGALDTAFGTNGMYSSGGITRSYPSSFYLVNGELVLLAYVEASPIWNKYIQKLDPDSGVPISNWGTNGTVTYDTQTEFVDSYLNHSIVINDQMILSGSNGASFALVSVDLKTGELSDKFGTNGIYISSAQTPNQQINRLAIDPTTKKLWGVGYADSTSANLLLNVINFQ
jgi:uncharacterized delta-60 repeat protein